MNKPKMIFTVLLLIAAMLFVACDGDDDPTTTPPTNDGNTNTDSGSNDNANDTNSNDGNENAGNDNDDNGNENDNDDDNGNNNISSAGSMDELLEGVNSGEMPLIGGEERLDYGLGYFLYYAPVDSTGLDSVIYNALVVHKQLNDGEYTTENIDPRHQNLLDITDGIVFDPAVEITAQVGQTPEIRETIMGRVVESQQELSPEEALESNEVIGVVAVASGEDIGRKYLVYGQDTPDSEFEFLGVIIAVDASGQPVGSGETYSFQGWQDLPLLGDASGPFWTLIPTGVSGDPANTNEGRPGVLLVSESVYEELG
jgi:hypothetical protein